MNYCNHIRYFPVYALLFFILFSPFKYYSQSSEKFKPDYKKTAEENPFVFEWGKSFNETKQELKTGEIILEEPGIRLLTKKDGLRYEYYFSNKEKIKEILLEKNSETKLMQFSKIILEPEDSPLKSPLYAATIDLSGIPFGEETKNNLLKKLSELYGSHKNMGSFLELKGKDTEVRVYFNEYKNKTYLQKITFMSLEFGEARNKYFKERDAKFKEAIEKRVREANAVSTKN